MLSKLVADLKQALLPADSTSGGYVATPTRIMQAIVNQPTLSGWLPYSAYLEDEKIFVNQDSLGFCLELQPQSGADEEMAQILLPLFTGSRAKTGIQLHLLGGAHIRSRLRRYANLRVLDEDTADHPRFGRTERNHNVYRAMARQRVAYYLRGAREALHAGYLLRNMRLVLSVTVPGNVEDLSSLEELILLREGMRTTFRAAGFPNRDWDAADLINWVSDLLNPQRAFADGHFAAYDDGRDLRAQIVDRDTVVRVSEMGINLSKPQTEHEVELRLLSIKSLPPRFALWNMGALIGDLYQGALQYPCPFLITLGVHVLEPEATKNWAFLKAARATTNASSYMARFLPDLREKKEDWDTVLKALGDGQHLVDTYHELALFAHPGNITRAEQTARAIWRSRGFELTSDTFMLAQALLASLPMTLSTRLYEDLKKLKRVTTKTTANAVHLAPLIGEWQGTATPVLILGGRRGQVMQLDVYDNPAGNYNVAIAGTSGSGKSVFLNEIAVSYLGVGAKVWIIDVGRSYEKTCHNLGGEFIEFTEGAHICLNPFSFVDDINEDMEMLQPVLAQMVSPREPLENFLYSSLGTAIKKVWNAKGRDMTVTDVFELLNAGRIDEGPHEVDRRLRDLAAMLQPFTREGVYGRYFEGPATIDFSNDFVVLELEELKAKKDLQSVVLLIVLYRITREMYFSRERKKIVIIDEAWDLMNGGSTAEFIEAGYRRARKYKGSFMSATQGIDDYYKNPAATAALNNSDWVFLLRQKKESIEMLDKLGRLSMDEGMKRMLQSLRTEHGAYSEIFISSPVGSGIGRLIVDPVSLLLYSSKAEDVSAIDAKRAAGLTLAQAIEAVLEERGQR
jgi:conjugal transfer ATP-binding protein TraC